MGNSTKKLKKLTRNNPNKPFRGFWIGNGFFLVLDKVADCSVIANKKNKLK